MQIDYYTDQLLRLWKKGSIVTPEEEEKDNNSTGILLNKNQQDYTPWFLSYQIRDVFI